ncbi:MAG: single-stranded DNA-binding protein [Legionellales bacterium]|nr:single-stranded DNA-binding protein [Legionellales bacterium]
MISVVFESYIVEGNRARKDRAALIMYNLIWSKARFKNILKILFFLLTDFGNAYRVINNGHRGGDRHFRKIATNYLLKLTLITQAGVINAKNSLYKTYIYFNQKLLEIFKEFSNFDFGELLIHKSRLFLTIIERDFPMNDAIQKYTNTITLGGEIADNVQLIKTINGQRIATVVLATTDTYKNLYTNEQNEIAEFHRIVFFGELVTDILQFKLANFIEVTGQLRQCSEQNSSGVKNYFSEIWATDFKQIKNENNVVNIMGGTYE